MNMGVGHVILLLHRRSFQWGRWANARGIPGIQQILSRAHSPGGNALKTHFTDLDGAPITAPTLLFLMII